MLNRTIVVAALVTAVQVLFFLYPEVQGLACEVP